MQQTSGIIFLGNRRFTCLSPTLVRIEFSPTGAFDDRRSMAAYATKQPVPFASVGKDGQWDVITTGAIEIRTSRNDLPCNRLNLELRWTDGKLVQFWRPEDRDYQNLGGTLRSLDRYSGEAAVLDGVHPATMESPDISGTSWPAWIQCEVDPLLDALHPQAPAHFNKADWLSGAHKPANENGVFIERTFNWYKDARKFCPGILSRSGYFLLNDSQGAVLDVDDFPVERSLPGYQDWYFFGYAKDYQQALRDFRLLSGPAPLPRHKSLGIVYSRWPAFSETEVDDLGKSFAANGYPLSTLVMDMEWHKEGWGHWEFNPELIPDPKRFFALCHQYGMEVTFNDHPLDVRDDDKHYAEYVKLAGPDVEIRKREYNGKHPMMAKVDITKKQQCKAFQAVCHTEFMQLGLDYWWNDGSRGQLSGTCGQLVANKVFFEESQRDGRRGMLLARYGGIGSHRYGVFFTGDATSDYHVLGLQCEFNIRAAGVGLSNVSHDIGGFVISAKKLIKNGAGVDILDPQMYLRWLQFGVFTAILRLHSCPGSGSRLPADYEEMLNGACRRWLRIRHSLLPYIYTAMRHHCDTGIPLIRGMFLTDPGNPQAYRWDQYFFGQDMVVAPILSASNTRSIYLPAGSWWTFDGMEQVAGGREFTRECGNDEVPVYVRAGSILPRQSPDAELHASQIAHLELDVYTGAAGTAELYEDDGSTTGYLQGAGLRSRFTLEQTDNTLIVSGAVTAGTPTTAERCITLQLHHGQRIVRAEWSGKGDIAINRLESGIQVISLPSQPTLHSWSVKFVF